MHISEGVLSTPVLLGGAALGERRRKLQMRLDRQPARDPGQDAA